VSRRLGIGLLWLGVLVRAAGGRLLSPLAGGSGWADVWKARRTWMRGYPPGEAAGPSTAELGSPSPAPPGGR
jgi:hypothetical protein